MSTGIDYLLNRASEAELAEHLSRCNANFVPILSARVEISGYAKKIASKATRHEAWSGSTLVGLLAAYCNDQQTRIAYITSISVVKEWMGHGIAARLMGLCVEQARAVGMQQISLEVASANAPAIELYEKCGFTAHAENAPFVGMTLYLKDGEAHEGQA